MIEVVLLASVLAALLVLPGAAVAKALRLPAAVALASGPAITLGVVGISTLLLGFTPIRWNLTTAALVFLLLGGLGSLYSRRWPPTEQVDPVSWRSLTIIAVGVALGAGFFGFTCLRWMQKHTTRGFDNISQVWDALWHANLIRFIAETGVASPIRAGELINSDNHALFFYPNAWHALVALAEPLTGAGYPRLYNIASVVSPAIVVPASVAALAWRLVRDRLAERWAAYGASAAAAGSALFPSLYEEEAFGSVPSAVAVALAPLVVVLVMSCLRDRRRLPAAVLAFAGVTAAHPSAAVVTALAVIFWWLTKLLWRPVRSRVGDFLTLATVPVVAGALLAPMALGLRSVLEETKAFAFYWYDLGLSRRDSVLQTVELLSRTADPSIPFEHRAQLVLPLVAVAAVGLVVVVLFRQWWAVAVWALFALLAVNDLKPFGAGACNPYPNCGPLPFSPAGKPSLEWPKHTLPWFLDQISGSLYHDPHRLAEVLNLWTMGFFGVAVAAGLALAARLLRLVRVPDRLAGAATFMVFVLVLCAIAQQADRMSAERGALASSSRDDRLVGLVEIKAFHWLAAQPGAKDTVILNNLDQGSGWMYAEAGLKPMAAHYRIPSWSADQSCVFWFVPSADTDWRVAAALTRLHVRYVLESPPSYWPDRPDSFAHLEDRPGVKIVYHDGLTTIYQLVQMATRHDQEDPVVSKDPNHFCHG